MAIKIFNSLPNELRVLALNAFRREINYILIGTMLFNGCYINSVKEFLESDT